MKDFTKLNVACLKDMQMLLATISDTTLRLNNVLLIEKNKISRYLNESLPINFKLEEWENGVDVFSEDDSEENFFIPDLEIVYSTSINRIVKKDSIRSFDLYIGYISNKKQNVIYAHLFNDYEYLILTESFISELKERVSQEWRCDSDNTSEVPNIYIEFSIDDNFTIEKIEACIQVFKEQILQAIIEKLQS